MLAPVRMKEQGKVKGSTVSPHRPQGGGGRTRQCQPVPPHPPPPVVPVGGACQSDFGVSVGGVRSSDFGACGLRDRGRSLSATRVFLRRFPLCLYSPTARRVRSLTGDVVCVRRLSANLVTSPVKLYCSSLTYTCYMYHLRVYYATV